MKIIEVSTPQDERDFLEVAVEIYTNDPVWVRPLDADVESIFDPSENDYFNHGVCTRFVLKTESNELLGRVAVFINDDKASLYDQPTGGMGFFDCIESKEAAFMLFDTAKEWLKERGMEAMDGPINFGENDMWWGLLIDGFTHPSYGMNYNPPYYQSYFEEYGFKRYYEQVSRHIPMSSDMSKNLPDRFKKIALWVIGKEGHELVSLDLKNKDRFVDAFVEIYNEAWVNHEGFKPIRRDGVEANFQKLEALMDTSFIWFSFVHGEPAGALVVVPDANQIIKTMNGKLNVIGKLKFLYHKLTGKITRARVIIIGVKPKFQKLGLEAAMIYKLHEAVLVRKRYEEVEISWVGDFNPKMQSLLAATNAGPGKIHNTYRYMFDPNAEFKGPMVIK
jgi:hypothetical protein